jgi:polyvinyl alcohol dehydrogenase (cytochrome)
MQPNISRASGIILTCLAGLIVTLTSIVAGSQDQSAIKEGEVLYRQRCAGCHDAGVPRAPDRAALGHISADNIQVALTSGIMSSQGASLTAPQIAAIASFLGRQSGANQPSLIDDACPKGGGKAFTNPFNQPSWNGWGASPSQTRFQTAEMAGLRPDQVPKLKLKWAFGFAGVGQAYAQPAVVSGRVFVGSAAGKVYSLSADTGCVYWVFDAQAPVRTAITVGAVGARWAVYFGDRRANAYALDAITGALLWKTHLDEHRGAVITGAPTLAGGKLYVPMSSYEEVLGAAPSYECCKFRGSVSALDAATGKVIWKTYTIAEEPKAIRKNKQGVQLWGPSGAAVWSSPTVDLKKHMVYVATGDSYSDPPASTSDAFMAFDSQTGKLAWSRQLTAGDAFNNDCLRPPAVRDNCPDGNGPDFDFGSSPILVDLPNGRRALIAGQKSGVVHAVDPDRRGEILWQTRVGKGGRLGGVQWGSAADTKNVYVALSDVKSLGAARDKSGAQENLRGVPRMLDPKAGGGLFALKLETGEVVWHTPHPGCGDKPGCSPAQSAAVSLIPGVVFSGGLDGHLRAYSTTNGQIIWDVDTQQDYTTVNGVKANGGSLDGPGPVIVGGMLYVNSGYLFQGGAPGNVLLAFSLDVK